MVASESLHVPFGSRRSPIDDLDRLLYDVGDGQKVILVESHADPLAAILEIRLAPPLELETLLLEPISLLSALGAFMVCRG
jgi:hypothetical protein